jgi:hypothetical protein
VYSARADTADRSSRPSRLSGTKEFGARRRSPVGDDLCGEYGDKQEVESDPVGNAVATSGVLPCGKAYADWVEVWVQFG